MLKASASISKFNRQNNRTHKIDGEWPTPWIARFYFFLNELRSFSNDTGLEVNKRKWQAPGMVEGDFLRADSF